MSANTCPTCAGAGAVTNGFTNSTCPGCKGSGTADGVELFCGYELQITLTALQLTQAVLNFQTYPFKWIYAIAESTGAFEFNITHNSASYTFFNVQANVSGGGTGLVRGENFWGTGQQPMPLLQPYIFPYNTTITVNIRDLSNANNLVRLMFMGVQLVSNDNRTSR